METIEWLLREGGGGALPVSPQSWCAVSGGKYSVRHQNPPTLPSAKSNPHRTLNPFPALRIAVEPKHSPSEPRVQDASAPALAWGLRWGWEGCSHSPSWGSPSSDAWNGKHSPAQRLPHAEPPQQRDSIASLQKSRNIKLKPPLLPTPPKRCKKKKKATKPINSI